MQVIIAGAEVWGDFPRDSGAGPLRPMVKRARATTPSRIDQLPLIECGPLTMR